MMKWRRVWRDLIIMSSRSLSSLPTLMVIDIFFQGKPDQLLSKENGLEKRLPANMAVSRHPIDQDSHDTISEPR